MEHHAQRIDDALIGGLSYKLKAGASYVTNRRSVSYFASGGNTYSPNGVKVMKFNLVISGSIRVLFVLLSNLIITMEILVVPLVFRSCFNRFRGILPFSFVGLD